MNTIEILTKMMKLYAIFVLSFIVHQVVIYPAANVTDDNDQITRLVVSFLGMAILYGFINTAARDFPRVAVWINWLLN